MGGSLKLAIMMNPFGEWNTNKGDHHTDLEIEPEEWDALFFDVLGIPERWNYIDGQLEAVEFNKEQFQEILTGKGYPMLGRIWFIYRDAAYQPSEVNQLLTECLKLQKKTEHVQALSALEKLIVTCREALEQKSGMLLLSD